MSKTIIISKTESKNNNQWSQRVWLCRVRYEHNPEIWTELMSESRIKHIELLEKLRPAFDPKEFVKIEKELDTLMEVSFDEGRNQQDNYPSATN